MKAVRWHGRGDVRLDDLPDPDPPGPGEVVLRVVLCGLCGTDFEEVRAGPLTIPVGTPHPLTGRTAPITLGHEVLGEVAAVGPGVVVPAVGDRVVPDGLASCGTCGACARGRPTLCSSLASIGLHRDGGLAHHLTVPATTCVPVASAVADTVAVLVEPLAVAVRAVRRAAVRPADRVLVIGLGAVGRCVAAVAASAGHEVLVADAEPGRVDRAFTADDRLRPAPDGECSADVVFDCAGTVASFDRALAAAARGGTVVLVGVAESVPHFSPLAVALKELTLVTSLSHDRDIDTRPAADLLATGDLRLDTVVDRIVPLSAAAAVLSGRSAGGATKTAVAPWARIDQNDGRR